MAGKRRQGGDLRWLVTIRKPNETPDASNFQVADYTADASVIDRDVPCEWIEVSGGERVRNVQIVATANCMLMIRYQKKLDPIHTEEVVTYRFYRQDNPAAFLEVVRVSDPYGTQEWLAIQGIRKVL